MVPEPTMDMEDPTFDPTDPLTQSVLDMYRDINRFQRSLRDLDLARDLRSAIENSGALRAAQDLEHLGDLVRERMRFESSWISKPVLEDLVDPLHLRRLQEALEQSSEAVRAISRLAEHLASTRIFDEFVEDRLALRGEVDNEVSAVSESDLSASLEVTLEQGWELPDLSEWLRPKSIWDVLTLLQLLGIVLYLVFDWSLEDVRDWLVNPSPIEPEQLERARPWVLKEIRRDAPLRDAGTSTAKEIGQASAGAIVLALDGGDRWCQVRTLDFQEGWMFRGHLGERLDEP